MPQHGQAVSYTHLDAYYQCPYTGSLFFGGIDGLLYLDRKVAAAPKFYPDIVLRRLWLGRGILYLANGSPTSMPLLRAMMMMRLKNCMNLAVVL